MAVSFNAVVMLSSVLANIAVALGILVAIFQLRSASRSREEAHYASFLGRIQDHNWRVSEDKARLIATEIFLGDAIGSPGERPKVDDWSLYWATRLVHLNHLYMLEQVWVLAGSPPYFTGKLANWQRIAERLVLHLGGSVEAPAPYAKACADIWLGLSTYQRTPREFNDWLANLSTKADRPAADKMA